MSRKAITRARLPGKPPVRYRVATDLGRARGYFTSLVDEAIKPFVEWGGRVAQTIAAWANILNFLGERRSAGAKRWQQLLGRFRHAQQTTCQDFVDAIDAASAEWGRRIAADNQARIDEQKSYLHNWREALKTSIADELRSWRDLWQAKTSIVADSVRKIGDLQREAAEQRVSWEERVSGLRAAGKTGVALAKEQARMGRYFTGLGRQAGAAGQFATARQRLERGMGYYQQIAGDTSLSKRSRQRAFEEMKKLQSEIEQGFKAEQQKAKDAMQSAREEIAQIEARVAALKKDTAAALQFKTNAAEVKAQIEELSDALNQLVAKEFTVHITQAHAAGGPVLGSETVPARLAPGEFVMNVPATRRFAPLLDAMNKGRDVIVPQRFAGGGPVGDVVNINQTFNGPGDKEYARRVMIPAIEQAVRRGRAGRPW